MQHLINLYFGLDKHYNCQNRKIWWHVLVFLPWLEEEYLLLTSYYVTYYVIDFITRERVQTNDLSCNFMVFRIVIWAIPLYKAVIPSFCETFLTTSKIPFQMVTIKFPRNFQICYLFGKSRGSFMDCKSISWWIFCPEITSAIFQDFRFFLEFTDRD